MTMRNIDGEPAKPTGCPHLHLPSARRSPDEKGYAATTAVYPGGAMFGNYKGQKPSFYDFASAARPVQAERRSEIIERPTGSRFVVAKHRPTGTGPVVAFTV